MVWIIIEGLRSSEIQLESVGHVKMWVKKMWARPKGQVQIYWSRSSSNVIQWIRYFNMNSIEVAMFGDNDKIKKCPIPCPKQLPLESFSSTYLVSLLSMTVESLLSLFVSKHTVIHTVTYHIHYDLIYSVDSVFKQLSTSPSQQDITKKCLDLSRADGKEYLPRECPNYIWHIVTHSAYHVYSLEYCCYSYLEQANSHNFSDSFFTTVYSPNTLIAIVSLQAPAFTDHQLTTKHIQPYITHRYHEAYCWFPPRPRSKP